MEEDKNYEFIIAMCDLIVLARRVSKDDFNFLLKANKNSNSIGLIKEFGKLRVH